MVVLQNGRGAHMPQLSGMHKASPYAYSAEIKQSRADLEFHWAEWGHCDHMHPGRWHSSSTSSMPPKHDVRLSMTSTRCEWSRLHLTGGS